MHIPGKNPVRQVAKESSGLVDKTNKQSNADSLDWMKLKINCWLALHIHFFKCRIYLKSLNSSLAHILSSVKIRCPINGLLLSAINSLITLCDADLSKAVIDLTADNLSSSDEWCLLPMKNK